MNLLKIVLLPISILYGIIIHVRNFLYDTNILKSCSFPLPVISVGNLSLGGTGKTPHIEYLIRLLKKEYTVASLSRGYGRSSRGFLMVNENSKAEEVGDECLQFKLKFPDIHVAVDENRCHGVEKLLEQKPKPDIILLDDAFQHRRINPGFSILLTDFHKLYSNDYFFPTGTLRDSVRSAKRADIIVVTKTGPVMSPIMQRILTEQLKPGKTQKIFYSYIKYDEPLSINGLPLQLTENKINTILLFAGIANIYPIQYYLQKKCNDLITIDFRDHHQYTKADLRNIRKTYNDIFSKNKIIITTEKDVMRLKKHEFIEELKGLPIYYIPIKVNIHKGFKKDFNKQINDYVKNNLSISR